MNLPFFIAGRYLFAKKSHNVINIISAISALGMLIGTAALIIILSVYNGFDSMVRTMVGKVEPDLLITPAEGKVFVPEGEAYDWLYEQESVETVCTLLEENVFISYDGRQGIAKVRGVDGIYENEAPLKNYMRSGELKLKRGEVPLACAGNALAHEMGINPRFLAAIELYFPSRTRNISLSNPAASIETVNVYPTGIFSVNNETDDKSLVVSIDVMRELLEYRDEVSAVEVRMLEGTEFKEVERVRRELALRLGEEFKVSDRFMQNEALYKMMSYEKASIFLILIFVIIIIAFNIFGSLSMLIIEKKGDIETLRSMGATDVLIRKIFVLEGWLISLLGLAGGLLSGISFALLQQQFGFIKMPGNFIVQAYPIVIEWSDVLITAGGVGLIGYLIARSAVFFRFASSSR